MVKLTRIYTRGGDKGKTSLGDGTRVAKQSLRIAKVIVCFGEIPLDFRVRRIAFLQSFEDRMRLLMLLEARLTVQQLYLQLTQSVIGARRFLLGICVEGVGAHDLVAKCQTLAVMFARGLFVSG